MGLLKSAATLGFCAGLLAQCVSPGTRPEWQEPSAEPGGLAEPGGVTEPIGEAEPEPLGNTNDTPHRSDIDGTGNPPTNDLVEPSDQDARSDEPEPETLPETEPVQPDPPDGADGDVTDGDALVEPDSSDSVEGIDGGPPTCAVKGCQALNEMRCATDTVYASIETCLYDDELWCLAWNVEPCS